MGIMGTKDNKEFIKGIQEIYKTYRPAYDNLYTVNIYSNSSTKDSEGIDLSTYVTYHAKRVKLDGESLNLKRNDVTKRFQLDSNPYQLANTLTITWRENSMWYVRKYHEDWLGLFYDKNTDQYKSKKTDAERSELYKNFDIILPIDDTFDSTNASSKMASNVIRCYNVIPQNISDISLGWASTSNIVEHAITYYIERWEWVSRDIGGGIY